jgi:hypothetical protein
LKEHLPDWLFCRFMKAVGAIVAVTPARYRSSGDAGREVRNKQLAGSPLLAGFDTDKPTRAVDRGQPTDQGGSIAPWYR